MFFTHGKGILLCLLCCFVFMLMGCGSFAAETSADPIAMLEESILFEDGTVAFQIPEELTGEWSILVYGRIENPEAGGMSAHYLEGETWISGQRYSFSPAENHSELNMSVSYRERGQTWERDIDLLPNIIL